MVLWKSDHPNLDIPTNLTTWQWAFERPPAHGRYENVATKERLSYAQVKDHATHVSAALTKRYGFRAGETVSLFASNSVWYPVALWAAVRVGGRVNGASPAYGVEEMVHALRTAGTRVLFTLPEALGVAVAAAERVDGLARERIFLLEGEREGFATMRELIALGKQLAPPPPPWRIPPGKTNRDVCGYLNFSSGTTGLPKAVMLSHHNIIAQCHQLRQVQVLEPPPERYRILAVTPLFHITGLVRYIHYPLLMDGDSLMLPAFSTRAMCEAIVAYRVPELILVPPIVIRVVRDPVVEQFLPDLRRIVKRWSSGSAPTSPEIIELLRRKFPDTGFRQGYGATESTACISCHPPGYYDYKYAHTGGKLCANTVAKVLDINDPNRELGPNETGEICAKGPQIAMGYLDNPTATAETFDADGFFHTGDVGHLDEEGLIYIEDRIKEMIKVRGQQVAPAELEDVLLGHEAVEDCAVLGIADEYSGEKPKAYVLLKESVKPSQELGAQLMGFVKEKKVRYKWLLELEFTDNIPKSPTGKLLRRVLKANDRREDRVRGLVVREERAKL